MEFEVAYDFDNEDQFWAELDDIVAKDCPTNTHIDNALRSYLNLTTTYSGDYLRSDYEVAKCSYKLHSSPLFRKYPEYIRRQIVHCLLQDDNVKSLHLIASFLLADGKENESTFELMNKEGAFCRLVDLIAKPREDGELGLHRMLMALLYEMSRIQKITIDDLMHVTDDFIIELFRIIELVSDDVNDPYHYPVIRVLLVLNEQYMVAAHDPSIENTSSPPLTNKVIKAISAHGSDYKSFGENIILLLNREDETSLQLLTLKLLYLLFTTPQTYEYFYTNDLRVLVDILIRNLLDLPEDAGALRHTYLRVLYPLLAHTQLRHPPQYKRDEIRKLLAVLARGQVVDDEHVGPTDARWGHFEEVDETTKRLVRRCQKVTWLTDPDAESIIQIDSPVEEKSAPTSPTSPTKSFLPGRLVKRHSSKNSDLSIGPYLTPNLESARQSSISMMEMATQREKPGVITPSRNPSKKEGLRAAILGKKEKPPVPKARRSGWTRGKLSRADTSTMEVARAHLLDPETSLADTTQEISSESIESTSTSAIKPGVSTSEPSVPASVSSQRKPPPAPRARRWRGRRSREDGPDQGHGNGLNRERGKFDSVLPSIVTSSTEDTALVSPFSPEEKTLVPNVEGSKESISEALDQVQAQAITVIGETLEQMRIEEQRLPSIPEVTRPTQAVLAPPSLAPGRGVPGPQWELERSPFLSDAEIDMGDLEEQEEDGFASDGH